MDIKCYIDDGANWQAQCVLAYLRVISDSAIDESWNKEKGFYEARFEVGRYENCREQGYVFSVFYKCKQRNYAVYEHRNSDQLCVVVFDEVTINTPTLERVCEAMGNNKYNYTKSFSCGQIVQCGDYIFDDIRNFIKNLKEK